MSRKAEFQVRRWVEKLWVVVAGMAVPALCWCPVPASALHATNADTIFNAYNNAFYHVSGGSGYYKETTAGGQTWFWGQAEEIEMAIDNYDRTESATTRTMLSALCTGFINRNGTDWTWNEYNDDIAWAVIAFCRTYQITGNTTFRDRAKANFDAMYSRAWDTNFTGGGLWWRTDKQCKNACINGPAAVGACYLFEIYGDASYLAKAQDCYAWERRVLFNTNSGAIYDCINTNGTYNTWASTYNQGTFIGAGTFLFKFTGLPLYYQDALLTANYTKNSLCSGGILPAYSSGDLAGFNGIFARWMGKMAREQNLWATFGAWLNSNADAAWKVRNTNNLAWYNWTSPTPAGTNILKSWDCSSAVVMTQVGCTNTPDALRISPEAGFTAVAPYSFAPASTSLDLILTNTSAAAVNWSLGNASAWLSASATSGTLAGAGPAFALTISLNPAGVTNLAASRYDATVWLTNQTAATVQRRSFALIVSSANTPIAMTGFNARIVAPNTATVSAPNASAIDLVNGYSFYQAGLGTSTRGLPPQGVFTSQYDSNTVFQLGPYGVTNTLLMGYTYPKYGTLVLKNPRAYNSLAILATSASASSAGGVGTLVLNFTNGTRSQVFNFYAPDWFSSSNNFAIQGVGRYRLSTGVVVNNGAAAPRLYQTTLNLAALGYNEAIASITFSNSTSAGANQVGAILGVSGSVMPPQANIVQQPQSLTNNVPSQGAAFSVVASGNAPLSYQWYYSASGTAGSYTALPGQTDASLVLNAELQPTNAGRYYVTVSNSLGAVTSAVVSLTIYRAPAIVQQPAPANLYALAGTTERLSVGANAALPVCYFWVTNGVHIPRATNSTCTLSNLQVSQSGSYSVVVSNAYGMATSAVVALTVLPAPTYPYGQAMLTNGAIGYWRLDEIGGLVARDCLGTNNGVYSPKVLLGQPGHKLVDTHTCARFGYLAASNSCVTNIGIDFATASSATFTVEAWVNGSAQTTDAGIITKGYGSGGEQFNLDCGGSSRGFRFFVRDASGSARLASSGVVPDGRWHHVVGVCDQPNGQVILYVDGTNVAQGTIGIGSGLLSSTLPMSIGARQSGAGKPYDFQFVGYIEEVAVYASALSSNQVRAHFSMASNRPPAFLSDPLMLGAANAGQTYSGTLATNAADPNGDAITYAKVSGPAWLSVAGNGALTGKPYSADVGTNRFQVSATDSSGLADAATMILQVAAPAPTIATLSAQQTKLVLSWSGGIAPYEVMMATNLASPVWQPVQSSLAATNVTVSPTNPAAFYRVRGQ